MMTGDQKQLHPRDQRSHDATHLKPTTCVCDMFRSFVMCVKVCIWESLMQDFLKW